LEKPDDRRTGYRQPGAVASGGTGAARIAGGRTRFDPGGYSGAGIPRRGLQDHKPWRRRIETAIEFGMLEARRFNPFPYEPGDVVFIFGCSTWLIDRDDYRTWRAAQSDPPEDSFIRFWLDDPDQGEPRQSEAGELAPPPQGEPAHVLSDRDIKTLRDAGQSVDAIHEQYGIPRDRIKRVNKRFGIHPLSRGPKPKTSD